MSIRPPCHAIGDRPNSCAALVYEQRIEGRFDLTGDWAAWKIRAGRLVGPGGMRFTPEMLSAAWRWCNDLRQ